MIGPVALCLTLCLTACAAECPPARPMLPPVVYLQAVPEPELSGRTNAALVEWALELRAALRQANSDKEALRAWVNEEKRY